MKKNMLNKLIDKISYRGRRKRNLKETNENIKKYLKMSNSEFIMDYTEICSRYEHKKLIFTAFLIGIIISIIMNAWKYSYEFIFMLLTSESIVVVDLKNQAFILSLSIMLIISIVVIIILYDMVKNIYLLNRKKIFLEQIKDMRKNDKNR